MLKVTVISTDTTRYQPVVTVLDPNQRRGRLRVAGRRQGGGAGQCDGLRHAREPTARRRRYAVRVAQVTLQSPTGGPADADRALRRTRRDAAAHRRATSRGKAQPETPITYGAENSLNNASQIDPADRALGVPGADQRQGERREEARWPARDVHVALDGRAPEVNFRASRTARATRACTSFTTFVLDTIPPDVSFSLRPPAPGRPSPAGRRQGVRVRAPAPARHARRAARGPCCGATVEFWGDASHSRSISLTRGVGQGLLVIGGIARDLAGNATPLSAVPDRPGDRSGQLRGPVTLPSRSAHGRVTELAPSLLAWRQSADRQGWSSWCCCPA